jgi:hypothetical protein
MAFANEFANFNCPGLKPRAIENSFLNHRLKPVVKEKFRGMLASYFLKI